MKTRLLKLLLVMLIAGHAVAADKFYSDDPLQEEPPPRNAAGVKPRKLSDYYDLLENSFKERGERNKHGVTIGARNVNTLGEPMDGAWYRRRHYWNPMSSEELARGSGGNNHPSAEGTWTLVSAKSEGISPGFVMTDAKGDRYFVKFDPVSNPEMATGAEMIVSRLFYALGYHVPDDYLIYFAPERLIVGEGVQFTDSTGRKRTMTQRDLRKLLAKIPKNSNGKFRGIASLQIPGKPVGPFKYFGTRSDDPNDIIPHEHRRELRGLFVFCAWLSHNDSRSINTLDTLVEEGGSQYVRHFLMDFGTALGSASTSAKTARAGGEYYLDFKHALRQMATFGLAVPYWAHAHYPYYPSVGGFESATFRPDKWMPDYPNAAFLNRLPDDEFWAVKQVMAFTDDQIREIVKVAQYSDPRAAQYVADALIERRNKIGDTYLPRVLPLDRFAVEHGDLVFHDLAKEHGLEEKAPLRVTWSRFDNKTNQKTAISTAQGFHLPGDSGSAYLAADIWRGEDTKKTVTVYLRMTDSGAEVVGIDRTW
jgi:hypothetical protein